MGQKRIAAFDLSQEDEVIKQPRKRKDSKTAEITSGKDGGRLADMGEKMLAEEEARKAKLAKKSESKKSAAKSKTPKRSRERSRRYRLARSYIDRTKSYALTDAIEMLKKISIARFDASVEAHLNLTDEKLSVEVAFPHSTGKSIKVAIADDKLLKNIGKNKLDFDVLLATPAMMPKLMKLAKILGPKGLMPNPKSGTIVDDPAKKKKEMENGKTLIKSEPKAPLMHCVVGKISFKDKQLAENVGSVIKAVGLQRITKLTLASSMSPGVRVDLSGFKTKDLKLNT